MNKDDFTVLVSGDVEYVHYVVIAFKMTEQVDQRICAKFCIELEHSSVETNWIIQKAFGNNAVSAA